MTLEEFREDLINEIKSQSLIDSDYTTDVFTEYCKDIKVKIKWCSKEKGLDIWWKLYIINWEREKYKGVVYE